MARGQSTTFLGLETGLSFDRFQWVSSETEDLRAPFTVQGFGGVRVRQAFSTKWYLEIGFLVKDYNYGFTLKSLPEFSSGGNLFLSTQVPLRFGHRLSLAGDKIYLVPELGGVWAQNTSFGGRLEGNGSWSSADYAYQFGHEVDLSRRRHFFLLQSGLALEFKVMSKGQLRVFGQYNAGFSPVVRGEMWYQLNRAGRRYATLHHQGEFWAFGVGFLYPLKSW